MPPKIEPIQSESDLVQKTFSFGSKFPKWIKYPALVLGIFVAVGAAAFVGGKFFPIGPMSKQFWNNLKSHNERNLNNVSTTDQFAGWNTYRSEEYGFEFKYPQNWKISEQLMDLMQKEFTHDNVHLGGYIPLVDSSKENEYMTYVKNYEGPGSGFNWVGYNGDMVNIFFDNNSLSLDDMIESPEDELDGFWYENIRSLIVDGMSAKRGFAIRDYEGSKKTDVVEIQYPQNSNHRGVVRLEINFNKGNYQKEIFDGILSTFKFISTSNAEVDTREWKTYIDEKNGFSFKYPPDWVRSEQVGIDLELRKLYKPDNKNPGSMDGKCKFDLYTDALARKPKETVNDFYNHEEDSGSSNLLEDVTYGLAEGIHIRGDEISNSDDYILLPFGNSGVFKTSLYCGDDVRDIGIAVLDQILSTLKFTK